MTDSAGRQTRAMELVKYRHRCLICDTVFDAFESSTYAAQEEGLSLRSANAEVALLLWEDPVLHQMNR